MWNKWITGLSSGRRAGGRDNASGSPTASIRTMWSALPPCWTRAWSRLITRSGILNLSVVITFFSSIVILLMLVSFSRDPLADVRWAILERDVVRFAAIEKTDRVLIHEG